MSTHDTTINIIGCGRLGRTLAKLWSDTGAATIGGIYNRTLSSGEKARDFIQSGIAVVDIQQLPQATFWLIATPDSAIANTASELISKNSALTPGDIVFHCSGSQPADILKPVSATGVHIASVHPVHSFADPLRSQQGFSGTFCAMEGDSEAIAALDTLFGAIGARPFKLDCSPPHTERKALYHAATAVASNYLVTLLDAALEMLQQAGMERTQARELLGPIVRQTADNVCRHDCVGALTGPIARGDSETIGQHIDAIAANNPQLSTLYKVLGQYTLPLASQQGTARDEQLKQILKRLTEEIK